MRSAALLCFCLVGGAPPPVTGPGQYSRDVYQDAVQPYNGLYSRGVPLRTIRNGYVGPSNNKIFLPTSTTVPPTSVPGTEFREQEIPFRESAARSSLLPGNNSQERRPAPVAQQAERLIDNPRLPKGQVDGRAWAVPKFEDPKNDHPTTDPKNDAKIEEHDAEAETKGLTVPEPSPAALPLADVTSIDEATSSLDAPLGDDIDSEEPAPQPESTNPSPEESKPVGSLVDVFNKWGSNFGFEVVADISDGEESWGIQTIVEEVPSRSLYDSIGSIFNYLLS